MPLPTLCGIIEQSETLGGKMVGIRILNDESAHLGHNSFAEPVWVGKERDPYSVKLNSLATLYIQQ